MWNVKTKVIPLITAVREPSQNNPENTCATYRESTEKRYYRNSHIGHCTHTAESTNAKVRNIEHGK